MMIMHRVPTSPRAWRPRNHSSSQKKTITTGSTIFSPKYIWLKPTLRRHLLSIPNKVPMRSQSSSCGLVVGSSKWGHWAVDLQEDSGLALGCEGFCGPDLSGSSCIKNTVRWLHHKYCTHLVDTWLNVYPTTFTQCAVKVHQKAG